jgi:SPX domain protein involved in polyphosphate accumulation
MRECAACCCDDCDGLMLALSCPTPFRSNYLLTRATPYSQRAYTHPYKHSDKNLPSTFACKAFYVNRLHSQAWVRGDYSDIVVRLSNLYSLLRKDHVAAEHQDASQSFMRSTSKYWVKTEDVSRVKYAILKHLPVFLQKSSSGESDSQFTNSVYVDNDQLELYHGRLEKLAGAIALRLRWYGPGEPTTVFVERKTHNESWTGDVSVKERFIVSLSLCTCCCCYF